jgi:lysophospholipase L1-like esterase
VIWGFVNDVFRAPRAGVEAAAARARREVEAMVGAARARGIEPLLATEVTIRGRASWSEWLAGWVGWAMGKTSYDAYINAHVLRHNAWLREYARREGLLLLDVQTTLSDASGTRRAEYAQEDGSHITAAGYAAIDRYAIPILQAHFTRSTTPSGR